MVRYRIKIENCLNTLEELKTAIKNRTQRGDGFQLSGTISVDKRGFHVNHIACEKAKQRGVSNETRLRTSEDTVLKVTSGQFGDLVRQHGEDDDQCRGRAQTRKFNDFFLLSKTKAINRTATVVGNGYEAVEQAMKPFRSMDEDDPMNKHTVYSIGHMVTRDGSGYCEVFGCHNSILNVYRGSVQGVPLNLSFDTTHKTTKETEGLLLVGLVDPQQKFHAVVRCAFSTGIYAQGCRWFLSGAIYLLPLPP
jgi:hypothetical protein